MRGYVSRVVQTRLDCPLPTQDEDFPLRVEEPGWSSLVSPPALFKVPTKLFFVQLCSTFLKLCSTFPPLFHAWNTWRVREKWYNTWRSRRHQGGITPCRDNRSDTPLCAMIPPPTLCNWPCHSAMPGEIAMHAIFNCNSPSLSFHPYSFGNTLTLPFKPNSKFIISSFSTLVWPLSLAWKHFWEILFRISDRAAKWCQPLQRPALLPKGNQETLFQERWDWGICTAGNLFRKRVLLPFSWISGCQARLPLLTC